MDNSIGFTIQALRKQKGITQEQLANAVGVSTPAVSKWERNLSMPDITLLAPIARFFCVTVDDLLSFTPALTDEEAERIFKLCNDEFTLSFESGMAVCNEYMKKYPNDPTLSFLVAGAIQKHLLFSRDDSLREALIPQIISLYEAAAKNPKYTETANGALISMYMLGNQLDKAEEITMSLPGGLFLRDKMLAPIYLKKGEEEQALKLMQKNLYFEIFSAINSIMALAAQAQKNGQHEAAIKMHKDILSIVDMFGLESMLWKCTALAQIASVYSDMDMLDTAVEYIEQFAEDFSNRKSIDLSENIYFGKMEIKSGNEDLKQLKNAWHRLFTEEDEYTKLRENAKFNEVIAQVFACDC